MRGVAYSVRERKLLMRMHEKTFVGVESRDRHRSIATVWLVAALSTGRAAGALAQPSGSADRRADFASAGSRLGAGAHRVLSIRGHNRLRLPQPPRVAQRYEKSRPGEQLHMDLKYLYCWRNRLREFAYPAVDDFSREAVACIRPRRSSPDAVSFLEHVVETLPYRVESVMTDNDFIFTMRYAYISDRKTRFQQACKNMGIAHWLTKPFRPQTNGKVERFFRTLDEECFRIHNPSCSELRMQDLAEFVWYYNHQRPHLSLHGQTPIQRREAYFQQA